MNKYKTSTGELLSQNQIDRRRSQTYRELYEGDPHPSCGCGVAAQGTAHFVPQKVCKDIGKAEYCFLKINMIPSCHRCNSRIENISSVAEDDWFYEQLLKVTKLISKERYLKIIL